MQIVSITGEWASRPGSGALALAAGLVGLCIGSFLNVVICRLPQMLLAAEEGREPGLGLCFPASHCPRCRHRLTIADLIPVFSYLYRRASCRYCGGAISWQYPLVEALTALAFGALAWQLGWSWQFWGLALFSAMLLVLAVIDIRHYLLPDVLTLSLLWAGLLFNMGPGWVPLPLAVAGAAAGYGFLRGVGWAVQRLAQREGLGRGDAKLLAALGAWLGLHALCPIVLLACGMTLCAFVAVGRRQRGDTPQALPFGPALALAGVLVMAPHISAQCCSYSR